MSFHINAEGIYAGTFCGGLLFSADHGQTWTSRNSGLPPVTAITSVVQAGSELFMSTYSGVYGSADQGLNWRQAGTQLSGKVVYGMTTHGNDLFAATADNGVYMSSDKGNSWSSINDGFPEKLRTFCVCVNGSWLFAGTDGQGVWRHPL
jgi:photosystem II stability/assembly factor-like uncharacterized protein